MEISVRRLNNRVALQVPQELPLGLVFIVGAVRELQPSESAGGFATFHLVDRGYRLRCRLPQKVVEETLLEQGHRVRVSGQLSFETNAARYHLLASDVEILAATPTPAAPASAKPILTDIEERGQAASLVPGDLPPWVKQLAPPEIRQELGIEEVEPGDTVAVHARVDQQAATPSGGELPDDMLAFLSSAIDSDEDIELTPEMIEEYLPDAPRLAQVDKAAVAPPIAEREAVTERSVPTSRRARPVTRETPTSTPPPRRRVKAGTNHAG